MIIADRPLDVQTSIDIAPHDFRIKASSKAFLVLSKGLYSDARSSALREISCNAVDAHVAAGKASEPIHVHLPTMLEPFLSVKDNGIGMSDEQVMQLYTTYFESDKTNSNDYTGCMGLGSKSPFAYVDQFTVVSRYNGKKYNYNCHINAHGIPSMARISVENTSECNGVEVTWAVNRSDFYSFRNAAADLFRWFTVKPIVTGYTIDTDQPEYLYKTDNYAITETHEGTSRVIMGNVAYPINASDFDNCKIKLTEAETKLVDWGCNIFLPIGSVDVTASREKITYDDNSAQIVKKYLSQAVEYCQCEINKSITGAANLWEARCALFKSQHGILGQIKETSNFAWNNIPLKSFVTIPDEVKGWRLKRRKERYKKETMETVYADNIPIVINDIKTTGFTRTTKYLSNKGRDECYYFSNVTPEFLEQSGIQTVAIMASTLPKAETTRVPRRGGQTKAKMYQYTISGSKYNADWWKPTDVDLEEGGVYTEILYYKYKHVYSSESANFREPNDLKEVLNTIGLLGHNEPIHGIRPVDTKGLARFDEWVSLEAYVAGIIEEHKGLLDIATLIKQWNCFNHQNFSNCFKWLDDMDEVSPFSQFLLKIKKAKEAKSKAASAYMRLAGDFGHSLLLGDDDELNKLHKKVIARYPLFEFLDMDCTNNRRNAIMEYVKLMDATKPVVVI